MASEIRGDLANIHDEDLLRRMWHQAEDFGIKKEIRTHMYRLREERLREFYTIDDMDSSGFGPTKAPLTPSHGESLADQSFQSLKAKEIRDSASPSRDFQLSRPGAMVPDTSGWNIATSSEVSPDGRVRKTESIATTGGVQQLPSGHSEFAGKNKHVTKASHEGDDRNYIRSADESSATQFHEKSVTGDENSGRVETKSSTSKSSSHVTTSKFSSTNDNVPYAGPERQHLAQEIDDLLDTSRSSAIQRQHQNQQQQRHNETNQRIQNERYQIDDTTNTRILTNRHEDNVVNKLDSQNIQKEVDLLSAQPGVLISRSVDYPDPNTKVITETKQLPDGTTVTSRKYETKSASSKTFRSSSNQQHSTTSRTMVEDRAQRSRIEHINENEALRIRREQQQQLRDQSNKEIQGTNTNNIVKKTTRSESVTNDQTTSRRSSIQNYNSTDKFVRTENVKDQVENVFLDKNVHQSVKKDLNQQYRNQEFIDNERGYQPKPDSFVAPQNFTDTRIEHVTTIHETDRILRDNGQPTPAAGKPSYNSQRPASQKPSSTTPDRSTPMRDTRSSPFSERSQQYPQAQHVPRDAPDYPKESTPPNFRPDLSNQRPAMYEEMPKSTPSTGKPSYNVQPPAGKPSYTNSIRQTQKTETSEEVKELREIHVKRAQTSPDDDNFRGGPSHRPINDHTTGRRPVSPNQDVPTNTRPSKPTDRAPYYPRQPDQLSPNRKPTVENTDHGITTTTTTVRRSYHPKDRETSFSPEPSRQIPRYPQEHKDSEPVERYIPVNRPDQADYREPTAPAGKPSYAAQPHPNEKYPTSRQQASMRPDNNRPNEQEPNYPAGKPSHAGPRSGNNANRPSIDKEFPKESMRPQFPKDTYPEEPSLGAHDYREPEYRGSPSNQYRPKNERKPSLESHASTDTVRTNNTYTNTKISVEVDAAHDTFARSLRCISPSERGSVRSLRTSTTSIRSTPSPDKRSPRGRKPNRSPSRDSIPYSESSRISTSTVTKVNADTSNDFRRSPRKSSDTVVPKGKPSTEPAETTDSHRPTYVKKNSEPPTPKDQPPRKQSTFRPDVHESNKTIDRTTSRKESTHHITTVVKHIDKYPGEKMNPSNLSPSAKLKPGKVSPQKETRPSSQTIVTRTNTTPNKVSTKEPITHRQPKKQTPVPPIGKRGQPTKPGPVETTSRLTTDTISMRNAKTVSNVIAKEPKRSPQKIANKPYPEAAKASRSPHSSPERSSRPTQSRRILPADATDIPYNQTPNFTKRSTVTTRVETIVSRPEKPASKQPQAKYPAGSDDEGFEPESPRSSSPTSSVSDLVYQKGAPGEPEDEKPTMSSKTRADKFTKKEREIVVDDSTYDRRIYKKTTPSPERQLPRQSREPSIEFDRQEPHFNRDDSPNNNLPGGSQTSDADYPTGKPYQGTQSGPHSRKPEGHQPYVRDQTSGEEIEDLTDDQQRPEPFYLIEPRSQNTGDYKKPDEVKQPKRHPQLVRSETYEERCRKILGMDQQVDGPDDVKEKVPRRKSSTRGVSDFISTEQTIEERERAPIKHKFTGRDENLSDEELVPVPMKVYKAPSGKDSSKDHYDEISPDEDNEDYTEVTTTTVKSVRQQPKNISPNRQNEYSQKRPNPEVRPSKKQPANSTYNENDNCKSSRTSSTRKGLPKSPEVSPTRRANVVPVKFSNKKRIEHPDSYMPPKSETDSHKPRSETSPNSIRASEMIPSRTSKEQQNQQSPETSPIRKPARKPAEYTSPSRRTHDSSPKRHTKTDSYGRRPETSPTRKPVERMSPSRRSPATSPTRYTKTDAYGRRPETSLTRKPVERMSPSRRSPVTSPTRHTQTDSYGRRPETSPTRKRVEPVSPSRRSPASSPSRHTEPDSYGRTPETSPTRKPVEPVSPSRRSPATSPTKYTKTDAYGRRTETSPTRKPVERMSPSRRSPVTSPTRHIQTDSYGRRPETSPTRKRVEPVSPSRRSPASSPSRHTEPDSYGRRPETSPTRKPVERMSPSRRSPVTSPTRHTKTDSYGRRPETSPTRKPVERMSPSRRSPVTSPTRHTQTDSYGRRPETSPTRKPVERMSPPTRSPASSPSRKPVESNPSRKMQHPVPSTEPERVSIGKLPYGKSTASSPTRKPESDSPRYKPEASAPSRKAFDSIPKDRTPRGSNKIQPKDLPQDFLGEPISGSTQRNPSRDSPTYSPDRGQSPMKYTEIVTIVTETKTKEKSPPSKLKDKPQRPQPQPSHITTAKIHLSPPSERKPSSNEIKKSPKTQPTTVRSQKPFCGDTTAAKMSRSVPAQKPVGKLITTTTKTTTERISKNEEKMTTRKRPEDEYDDVESEPDDEDSDVPSDTEEVTTVIEAATSKSKNVPEISLPTRRYVFTDRKDSAPVYKTTSTEKDKVTRSTSESVIKTKLHQPKEEPDYSPYGELPRRKSLDKKRPIKCMATKTITLNDRLINSEDMEDVIIDIQLAKSSREPSPNRLVPTPVRPDENVSALRYPDNVQEPEDHARRRPKVKDIPILEEGTNDYIRCHISEVAEFDEKVEKRKTIRRMEDEEVDEPVATTRKPTRTTDSSSEYETMETRSPEPDDDCRLSVHDKVAKFISTAEEVSKPKPSAPFERVAHPDDVEPDDCLLSVNEKVSKFLTTTDSVSKVGSPTDSQRRPRRPDTDDIDEDLRNDESILSVSEKVNKFTTSIDKLVEDTPQQSPKLVAKIERQVSRKDDLPKGSDSEPYESTEPKEAPQPKNNVRQRYNPESTSHAPKPSGPKTAIPKSAEVVKKAKSVFENSNVSKNKQRDIIGRPSVWDQKRPAKDVRLQDIGVQNPFDDETEEIIKRERSRSRSPGASEDEPAPNKVTRMQKTIDVSRNSVSSKKNLFERQITNKSTTKTTNIRRKSQETVAPYGAQPLRQPSDLSRPSRNRPDESLPRIHPHGTDKISVVSKRAPKGVANDEEYIEEITTETRTKTMRTERRSPSRHCEYYSPERDSSPVRSRETSPERMVPGKQKKPVTSVPNNVPKASPTGRVDQHDYPYTPSKYSKRPENTSPGLAKPISRTEQPKSSVIRDPYDAHPVKKYSTKNVESSPTAHYPPGHRPSYMEPTVSSLVHRRDSTEIVKLPLRQGSLLAREPSDLSKAHSQDGPDSPAPSSHVPSYMEHTISSMEHRRDSLEIIKTNPRRSSQDSLHTEMQPRSAKFGVELKRAADMCDTSAPRKSISSELPNIEDIFDLEVLEKILETVVGYEQRRRIRAQIRVVRKMIEEEALLRTTTTTSSTRTVTRKGSDHSPIRKVDPQFGRLTEPSPDRRVGSAKKVPHGNKDTKSATDEFIESESHHITRHEKKTISERSISPQRKIRTVTTPTETRKNNGLPTSKKPNERQTDKPIWATKNILKKASESDRTTTVKRTNSSKHQKQTITKDDADSVISSYGIGPTDEDGKPLFGIRALKKKSPQPGETTKVTGRIVTESYYSENGAPPVGERKVTVYSNDPEDINSYEEIMDHKRKNDTSIRERTSTDGITSVTRLQKIGKPKDSEFSDIPALTDEQTDTKVKTVRKGSVKEMSEKLIRRGSSSSTTERTSTSSYPKAGLILRTQNYSSTENDDPFEDANVEFCTTRKQSRTQKFTESDSETEHHRVTKTTKSFLNSKGQKVTGVEDVLDRMRNADNVAEDGDTMEDREARSLLNKFLGASVLMSGVESMVPKSVVTRTVVESPGKHEVKTTRVTKTVTSGKSSSSPVARKTFDIEEIWDEEYLKQLLEQSTNYEERRRIRARIRQIMAEKQDIATKDKVEQKTEQQLKTELKSEKKVVKEEETIGSETESEYEEVEIIEEVTDDSSAEAEEEVEKAEDEGEDESSESNESSANADQKTIESSSSKSVEKDQPETPPNHQSNIKEKVEIVAEAKAEVAKREEELDKEQDAKEQSKLIILPLLQGLLQKQNSQSNNININNDSKSSSGNELVSKNSKASETVNPPQNEAMSAKRIDSTGLTVHHVEDSGTESGEDLKFIAAGLRDSLQMHSIQNQNENELITEVTSALNRLESSLREGKDLKLDVKKRNALLTLVARLQTGLISPEKITAPTPAPGQTADGDNELSSPDDGNRKFPRSGHQRFAKRRNRANRHTVGVSREELADARRYIEEMVMMESISNRTTPDSGNVVSPPEYPVQKQNSCGAVLVNDSPEPSTLYRPNQFVPNHLKEGKPDNKESIKVQMRERKSKAEPMRQTYHFEHFEPAAPQSEFSKRPYSHAYPVETTQTPRPVDPVHSTVEEKNIYNKTHHSAEAPPRAFAFSGMRPSAYQPQEAPAEIGKSNRFMNKKIMMKRANTIDIPKPIKYMNDMESDSEAEERGINSTKAIGLRGTVQVTVKSTPKSVVPAFQPKTENDLKFLAFIQKQSPSNGMIWNSGNRNQPGNPANNWSNKFGNIKNAFENGQMTISGKPPMPTGVSASARSFWKKADTAQVNVNSVPSSPKTPEKTAKPLWSDRHFPESPKLIAPKPIPVNKFSHAPLSAFKPISPIAYEKETVQFQPIPSIQKPIKQVNGSFSEPLSRRSPKQIPYVNQAPFVTQIPKSNQSPTLPWAGRPTAEGWVQNIAAKKFDNRPQRQNSARVQDQTYNDRVSGYNRLDQKRASLPNTAQYESDHLIAPQMVQDIVHAAIIKEFPPLTYTSTDYSQPSAYSTYVPEIAVTRSDSLTNPAAEPLVLTSDRPFISPYDQSESIPASPNCTQNEISDSEFDTDSITEYKAETKIMRGPVSQQAVTISNRTMRRGDEGKFGKNSKEAKSLLSIMKNIKPASAPVTKEGRSYQAPKVESILPVNEEINRFTNVTSPPVQVQSTVHGYNPIYQQPSHKKDKTFVQNQAIGQTKPFVSSKTVPVVPGKVPAPKTNNQNRRTTNPEAYQQAKAYVIYEPSSIRPGNFVEQGMQEVYRAAMHDNPIYQPAQKTTTSQQQRGERYSGQLHREEIFDRHPSKLIAASMQPMQQNLTPDSLKIRNRSQQQTVSASAPTTPEKRSQPFTASSESQSNPPTPKDEPKMIFKKFGPAQPHHYHPNSYQYPLVEPSRKYSEPNVKTVLVNEESRTTETTQTKEKDGATVTTTTKVTTRTIASAPKPVSPFAKFRQLDKQNSQNFPKNPSSPMTPGAANRGAPIFQFTDPTLNARAATVKEQLLQWCQMKTKEYENVQITNFSTSWSDGLAFCALIHHFLPDTFDYSKLTPKERRHNFELAFRIADEKADIAPLLDVEDMVVMRKPDWKCVFTYVQSIYRRFRNCS